MAARAPLDVDLEDRLVYGLTPIRLGYAVLAGLSGTTLWSQSWIVAPIRLFAVVFIFGSGAVLAWGRFRGRPVDEWVVDAALFAWATRRLKWK